METAREQAMANLRDNMTGITEVRDTHLEILSSPSDSIVRVKVAAETIEDICIPQPLEEGKVSN